MTIKVEAFSEPREEDETIVDVDLVRAYQRSGGRERALRREHIVARHTGLVHYLARRYAHKGEPVEDLFQVGMLGLLGAMERFDASRGVQFATFARPSIVGELKRYFRDKSWSVRVPRRLQELSLAAATGETELSQELGRTPTVTELAERLGTTEDDLLEALEAARSHNSISLEAPISFDSKSSIADVLGGECPDFETTESVVSLVPLLRELSPLDRHVLYRRFFERLTQSAIAAEIGVSQMQVSRILTRVLAHLRSSLKEPDTNGKGRHRDEAERRKDWS